MDPAVEAWLANSATGFLMRVGLKRGQTILDFGCNKGNYAGPAARVVGHSGKVYALDKDIEALEKLGREVRKQGLRNIECRHVSENGRIPLPARCVDVVLLYDILHRGYFPEPEERIKMLKGLHRVLKTGGLLSLYPTHLKKYGMTFGRLLSEVEAVGFELKAEARRRLIHDGSLTTGRLFSFIKRGR